MADLTCSKCGNDGADWIQDGVAYHSCCRPPKGSGAAAGSCLGQQSLAKYPSDVAIQRQRAYLIIQVAIGFVVGDQEPNRYSTIDSTTRVFPTWAEASKWLGDRFRGVPEE
jgi:hypothetical protein